jgi:toxin ParE1/3/4
MSDGFSAVAQRELFAAVQWYLQEGGQPVAEQFERAVQRAFSVLQFMPKIGRTSYPGVRTWPVKRFPYTLVYRVQAKQIVVIAVAHQSREPEYWIERI